MKAGKDPFFGRESLDFLVSELNKIGITQVENLTFDENFKLFWEFVVTTYIYKVNVRNIIMSQMRELENNIIEVMHDNPINAKFYASTRDKAKSWYGITMLSKVQFNATHVNFKSKKEFNSSQVNSESLVLKSAPLYRYLKEMNLVSHNYVADMIYAGISNEIFGDRSFNAIRYQASVDFEKFLHHDLGLTSKI